LIFKNKIFLLAFLGVLVSILYFFNPFLGKKIDYSTDIKPIINKNCIKCHGGVKQAGGFSLLFRDEALAKTKSGKPAIIPFHPEQSEFIARLTHKDLDERMPFKAEPLSKSDINKLTQWVKEGAEWGNHWAYVPPEATQKSHSLFSSIFSFDFFKSESKIDQFINEKISENNLKANNKAEKHILVRRLGLDLIGIPVPDKFAENYMKDNSDEAYETLVDSLLKLPAFGEKWASMWLDLARYSDSRGYQKDNARNIWKYRDWVIKALNNDMPFDQFSKEQLAGDLMPKATENQLIATAFHRNTMNNDETGTVDEEFRVAAVLDRVSTTYEVWQSTTMQCVQCHSHPYDPFKHDEFYKSMAFFNNTRDEDTQDEAAILREFNSKDQSKYDSLNIWLSINCTPEKRNEYITFIKTLEPRHHAHYADNYVKGALLGDRQIGLFNGGSCRLPIINLTGKTEMLMMYSNKKLGGTFSIHLDKPTGPIIGQFYCDTTKAGKYDFELRNVKIIPTKGQHDLYFTAQNNKIGPDTEIFKISWFKFLDNFPKVQNAENQLFKNKFEALIVAKSEDTPIMVENHPDYRRKTYQFTRGNWLMHGKEVQPNTPHSLNSFANTPNRLGLAQWLFDDKNPLTARVISNRIWEQLFGLGIVETLEDFGTQGAKPTHQELLDYLAIRLKNDYKWSLKKLIKEIVLSDAYQRTSNISGDQKAKDPTNKWLAHAPRLRLTAEQLRDQALVVSGLINPKMYGKPVLPYQPDGIWNAVNSSLKYEQSVGNENYRRAIYNFQRRTSPYPSFLAFDAGSREYCVSRRIRTNTPLQSLVLLNDPVYIEVANALANSSLTIKKDDPAQRIKYVYYKIFHNEINNTKLEKLLLLHKNAKDSFEKNPSKIKEYLGENGSKELASLSIVCNAILSLDESLVRN
jgi:Protein of unknown function (DUF1553)/Protein of unknown function (DUF1549)/Planctomycete cytochrome C/Carbohydrate binding module (family 6)